MMDFNGLGLPEDLNQSLRCMKINIPTPIQKEAIPLGIAGHDILASAQTGTGKTIAYMIPIVMGLMNNPQSKALVLTPTRELAVQVRDTWELITAFKASLRSALLIGGVPIPRQMDQLKKSPQLIVGTPGRVMDHIKRKSLKLENISFLVLDETDRMLDMGFSAQIEKIIRLIPENRQTFMFSATLPVDTVRLASKYLKKTRQIKIGNSKKPVDCIKQEFLSPVSKEKYTFLTKELDKRQGAVLVFVRTKRGARKLALRLQGGQYKVDAIHGDLRQHKRSKILSDFKNSRIRILVATDVAARGLDVPHIKHVINYDIPQCSEDYIHRIGRTGRAGSTGSSLCFITPEETHKWKKIDRAINF